MANIRNAARSAIRRWVLVLFVVAGTLAAVLPGAAPASATTCGLNFYWNTDGSQSWPSEQIASVPCGSAVAIVRSGNATEVAAQGNGNLYFFWNIDGSPSWQGGLVSGFAGLVGTPAITRFSGGTEIAVADQAGRLWYLWNNDGWPTWYSSQVAGSGAISTSTFPAITRSFGATEIAAAAPDGSLRFYWNNDGSPAWYSEQVDGPGAVSAGFSPAITRSGDGTAIAVVFYFNGGPLFGSGNRLRVYWNSDGSPAWQGNTVYYSGSTPSNPAIASPVGANLLASTQFTDHSLWFWWQTAGSSQWNPEQVAGASTAYGSPAMTTSSSAVEIAAQGPNGSLWFYWAADGTDTWTAEQVAGPGSVASVPAMTRSSSATELAVLGP